MSTCDKPKKEGRKADLSNGWFEHNKVEIMLIGLRLKFSNPSMKKKLLDTGNRELIEGNYWHDNFWGDCYCPKCVNTNGQNTLGKLLMQIRKEIHETDNG